MSTHISTAAAQARESARLGDGRFGEQHHLEGEFVVPEPPPADPVVEAVIEAIPSHYQSYYTDYDERELGDYYADECEDLLSNGEDMGLYNAWEDARREAIQIAEKEAIEQAAEHAGVDRDDLTDEQVEEIELALRERDDIWGEFEKQLASSNATFQVDIGDDNELPPCGDGDDVAFELIELAGKLGANTNNPEVRHALRRAAQINEDQWRDGADVALVWRGNLRDAGTAVRTGEKRRVNGYLVVGTDDTMIPIGELNRYFEPGSLSVYDREASWENGAPKLNPDYDQITDRFGFDPGLGDKVKVKGDTAVYEWGRHLTEAVIDEDGTLRRTGLTGKLSSGGQFRREEVYRPDRTWRKIDSDLDAEGRVTGTRLKELRADGTLVERSGDAVSTIARSIDVRGEVRQRVITETHYRHEHITDSSYRCTTVFSDERAALIGRTSLTNSLNRNGDTITGVWGTKDGDAAVNLKWSWGGLSGTVNTPDGKVFQVREYRPMHHNPLEIAARALEQIV